MRAHASMARAGTGPRPRPRAGPGPVLELAAVTKVYPGRTPVTALLHLAGTLDKPTSGAVRVAGLDVAGLSDRQLAGLRAESVGFVFQQFFLAEQQTALSNVAAGLLYAGYGPAERREQAAGALVRVGLGH